MIDESDVASYELSQNLNFRIFDAYLRFYMRTENPSKLSDEDWAERLQDLHFIRTQEKKASEK